MNIPETYNQDFIDYFKKEGKAYSDAGKYGVVILPPDPLPDHGAPCWRVVGIHHLTGAENHGQLNAFCDVLDSNGQRVHLARINILSNGNPRPDPSYMVIDKPDNEPGTNTQMHWNDTLTLWVDRLPSERVTGLNTRHDDEEAGTTRGHHSFYVVWYLGVWSEPAPEPEPEPTPDPTPDPDPPPPTGDWRDHFAPRQLKEIDYCLLYDTDRFRHGTDGHNIRLIVAKMARLLSGSS